MWIWQCTGFSQRYLPLALAVADYETCVWWTYQSTLQTCSSSRSVRYLFGVNVKYTRHKIACHDSDADRLEPALLGTEVGGANSADILYFSINAIQSHRHGGFGGLSLPNWNMKHYKLVEFLSKLNVKPPPCTNVKPPHWRHSGDGSDAISADMQRLDDVSVELSVKAC